MLGDRAKHCAFTLNGFAENLNVDEEAVKQISTDAVKDIEELIEKANRVDSLELLAASDIERFREGEKLVDELKKEVINLEKQINTMRKFRDKREQENEQLKADAELGQAVKSAYKEGFILSKQGYCLFSTNAVIDRYMMQKEGK